MIQVTAIRLAGGESHEHITDVRWRSGSTSAGQSTREAIVDWLSASNANQAVVAEGSERVHVAVVRAPEQPPYIRTHADGKWTDNLLTLPLF
jgi:Protein of unknown function (DUF3892)